MPASTIRLQQNTNDLVSEDVKDIISYRPHWMIRRGNIVFFSTLLLLLVLTFFIEYPDVINGTARLVAVNGPKTAVAHVPGKIIAITVSQKQQVITGQPLAYLESTADYKEVMPMHKWVNEKIEQVKNGTFSSLLTSALPVYNNLGDVQTAYQTLEHEWEEARQFYGSGYYQKKKLALQQDLLFTAKLKATISQQERLSQQEQHLQLDEYAAYDSLAKDKLVAPLELNKYKSGLLQKEQSLAQTSAQLITNDVTAHNQQKELLELQKAVTDQQQKLLSALLLLKTDTEKWIQQYAVSAPEAGQLFFIAPLQAAEQVTAGQELFYIQPASSNYYVQLTVGQNGLGKLKEGQQVRLKAESYPSEEFGYLKGSVSSISNYPNRRDSFLVKVDLLDKLTTTYGKEIFFRNNLIASGEIITDDRKLFDRFFDPLKRLWKQ